ncbi:hypothetical protein HFP15_31965 [Amycolatopsis sp. K13G38]|uniref:Prevent-host-death family protein n=1 Tax=Amycolatopsis acididurans TaxID=2724524 RepID=A0ABX1JGE6_9PSEU|nr:DUF6247 family protein [Amycolatopsis acididurans]NKQ57490.1 hypothetical protein [Amycolatopsis acididurans]
MTLAEVNLSDLLNRPKETLKKLQLSPGQALRVHRRAADEEDLLLTLSSRAEQARQASSAAAGILAVLVGYNDETRSAAMRVVPKVFPWARFLPPEDLTAFVTELVETLEAADSLENPAPVTRVLDAWHHTAEIHADPALRETLTQEGEDLGPVSEPAAAQ